MKRPQRFFFVHEHVGGRVDAAEPFTLAIDRDHLVVTDDEAGSGGLVFAVMVDANTRGNHLCVTAQAGLNSVNDGAFTCTLRVGESDEQTSHVTDRASDRRERFDACVKHVYLQKIMPH